MDESDDDRYSAPVNKKPGMSSTTGYGAPQNYWTGTPAGMKPGGGGGGGYGGPQDYSTGAPANRNNSNGAPLNVKPGMGGGGWRAGYGAPKNYSTAAPTNLKPGMGGGMSGYRAPSNASLPPSFKMGAMPAGPRRGSGGMMIPGQMACAAGRSAGGGGPDYNNSDDSSEEEYQERSYRPGSQPGGYGEYSGLPGNPMPGGGQPPAAQPQRLGEAERMRLRQLQMQQEASTKSGTEDHRPLVGAYEAARADHFRQVKTPAQQGERPRDLPSI